MNSEQFSKEIYNFLKEKTFVFFNMKNCNHSHSDGSINIHHEEGTVFNHTILVVEYLIKEYDDNLCKETIIAAYLHDYGKCFVREEIENKVRFFNHHNRSLNETIGVIKEIKNKIKSCKDINIPFILYLINFHMADKVDKFSIKDLAHKFKAIYKIVGTSLFTFIDQLFYIFEADNFGRIAENKKPLDYYKSNHEEALFYLKEINETENTYNSKYILDKEIETFSKPLCYILIGPSCSGKTTYVSSIDTKNFEIISRDSIVLDTYSKISNTKNFNYNTAFKNVDHVLVDKELNTKLSNSIKNQKNIIIDMTNCSYKSRRKILSKLTKNYIAIAKVFVESSENILKRNKFENGKNISEFVIFDMFNRFTLPTYDEFDKIEFVNL